MFSSRARRIAVRVIIHIVAWVIALLWLTPVMGVIMASFRPMSEIIAGWWNLHKVTITLENFKEAWTAMRRGLLNSFIVALPSTIIPLICGALAAYAFSRFSFLLRDLLFLLIVSLMAIPPQTVGIPLFILMNKLRLVDNLIGLALFHSANGLSWVILFLRNYLETLPRDLEDAARVDGASDIYIFFHIVLPLLKPALYSIMVLQFTWVWNDFFFALILIYSPHKLLATQRLVWFKGEYHVPWGTLCAGSILLMAIPIILYAVFQKYFIKGIVGGTIRG